jgi:hypothetical protein
MIHGVSAPGLSLRPYFNRYTEDAIDLCDALSSFSPQGKATLHEISRVMSLPGKPKGIDGGEVERYYEGKIKESPILRDGHSQYVPGCGCEPRRIGALMPAARINLSGRRLSSA